ncbi:MAG: DUF5011 domain-containing protein, partial [Bacteroidetes bacterium]|nr:DUF5011 domain-containing protein [Bacteroidota bacterium]
SEIFTKDFEVVDTIAPVIKLVGNPIVRLSQNDSYADSGYSISDNYYATISLKLDTLSNFISTANAGYFEIKYQAKDSSNNTGTSQTRMIHIGNNGIFGFEKSDKNFVIYPNPITLDYFYLQTEMKNFRINISDVLGKEIYQLTLNSDGKFQLPKTISNGIYIIGIVSNEVVLKKKITVLRTQ